MIEKPLSMPRPPSSRTKLQQKIIKIKQAHPALNKNQIAAVAGCHHVHVGRTLKAYGIIKGKVNNYISNRAMILAGVQQRLLASITDADIKKTPVGSRILAVSQLFDKERLERGQSTANVAYDAHTISASVSELRAMIAGAQGAQGDTDG